MQTHAEENVFGNGISSPSPEVPEKARRRSFSASYKLDILKKAEACKNAGEVGALLRREGLYSSHLALWRKQRRSGTLSVLSTKRGRKKKSQAEHEAAKLRRENTQLRRRLERAEYLLEVQKKVSEILGVTFPPVPHDDEGETD